VKEWILPLNKVPKDWQLQTLWCGEFLPGNDVSGSVDAAAGCGVFAITPAQKQSFLVLWKKINSYAVMIVPEQSQHSDAHRAQ
jgi:hypothetical protein